MEDKRTKYGKLSGQIGIVCNLFLAISKLLIGLLSGMVSIIADAVNNFSDAAASIVSLIGFKLASKPADDEHPFGHARYEYISGIVVALLVLVAGEELLKASIKKIVNPTEVEYSVPLFVVLLLSIAVKLGMAFFNYKLGRKIASPVIIATAQDSRNDVIATFGVLISAIISMICAVNLDGIMGLLISLFVLYSGIMLVKDTVEPLLGSAPDLESVREIENKILSYKGVLGTHDLMIHDYGPGRYFASVHVEVPAEANVLVCHELIDKIEADFLEQDNLHMVIHYDPIVTADEAVGKIREYMKACGKELDERISIHDLRIVPGEENTNVIFDCVVPRDCWLSEAEICQTMNEKLKMKYEKHTAVIKIDHSFVSLN